MKYKAKLTSANVEIYAKLDFLKKYVSELRKFSSCTLTELEKDSKLRGAVERYLQLSIEICLEIGEMLIANEGFRKATKHREVIEILGENNVLPKDFSEKFAPAGGLRNILVHMYDTIDTKKLYKNLKQVNDFDTFAKHIAKYLAKEK